MLVQPVAGTGGNPYTNALVAVKWLGSTLSYGFPTQSQYTGYDPGEEPSQSFEILSGVQQDAVRAALGMISTFTNLTFTEATGAAAGNAELRFGQSDAAATAFAYYPDPSPAGGDAWFNNSFNYYDSPVLGNYAFFTFMHEIGHTLGLGHPHESAQPMPSDRDWLGYTLMSYRSTQGGGLGYVGSYFPQSYMMEDIRALQLMYGANYGYQAGNTTYSFNPANGEMSINGVGQGVPSSNRLYRTLWDGGGVDTLDLSNFQGQTLAIDLQPGSMSSLTQMNGSQTVAMSHLFNGDPRSLIENVIGSQGSDGIHGNDADNTLSGLTGNDLLDGGNGNDLLFGGAQDDRLYGGDGNDTLNGDDGNDELYGQGGDDILTGGAGNDRLGGGTGNDIVYGSTGGGYLYGNEGDDRLYGSDQSDFMYGGTGADSLQGGGSYDSLYGEDGNDSLSGGDGDDNLDGGAGADTMIGGAGSDTYTLDDTGDAFTELAGDPGTDRLLTAVSVLDSTGIEVIELTGSGNLTAIGNSGANTIRGNAGNNVIDGGAGADAMSGGLGDDVFYVDDNGDSVSDSGGRDTIYSLVSFVLPSLMITIDPYAGASYQPPGPPQPYYPIEVLILAGSAAINGTGTDGADELIGNAAANTIQGRSGNDVLRGGDGWDALYGEAGDDIIYGDEGFDTLNGGAGADVLYGGEGNDTYTVDGLDTVIELEGQGVDLVFVATSYQLPDNVENISVYGINTGLTLTGNGLNNQIGGTSGNDIITGGLGFDRLYGYLGADTFVFTEADSLSSSLDFLEDFQSGQDRIDLSAIAVTEIAFSVVGEYNRITVSISPFNRFTIDVRGNVTLQDILVSLPGQVLNGGSGPDTLDGTSGGDTFYGGEGADRMSGLGGNDAYYVDTQNDIVVEAPGAGSDRVIASVTYALRSGIEIERLEPITLSGTEPLNFYGNEFAQTLLGNEGANILDGGAGNDTLQGQGGNDSLNGGAGADALYGGAGDDTYYVDDAGDRTFENAGEGTDRVAPGIDYTVPDLADIELIEALNYSSTSALNLGGSNTANTIAGNLGANVLRGFGGNDRLFGYAGDDVLDGGTGDDTMLGGTGNDVYYVDSTGDRIFEHSGEGHDRVAAIASIALPDDAEIELLEAINSTALEAMNLSGSAFANVIIGNAGINILRGAGGSDTLQGLGGDDFLDGGTGTDVMYGGNDNDTYYVDDPEDLVVEAAFQGSDRVATTVSYALGIGASIEFLEALTVGGTAPMALTGNELENRITGNAGANVIDGRLGSDVLVGLGGADQFRFSTTPGSGNSDTIADFMSGTDKIALDHAVFTRFNPGSLSAGSLRIGTAAQDGDDYIVYNQASGALSYDADGNGAGAAVQFATLTGSPALTAADFLIL